MKAKKPDIFLGITMCMLVLAAVLCIVILFVQKSGSGEKKPVPADTQISDHTADSAGSNTANTDSEPITTAAPQPVDLKNIDEAGLKAALDDALSGLTSEWQVMVMDPATGSQISSAVNCGVDDWMTANRMTQVFVMATAFQQVADGKLTEDKVLEDAKVMIIGGSTEAADRLTQNIGGGDAAKGRELVKTFAADNGVKLGYNRPLTGSSDYKNYVTAQQTAAVLNLLCQGKLVSESASAQMLEILLTPTDETPAFDFSALSGENVRYGFISDVEEGVCICTMGVVKLPNRSFVISVVCNKPVTTDGAKAKVTELLQKTLPFFQE